MAWWFLHASLQSAVRVGQNRRPGSPNPPSNLEHEAPIFAYSHGSTGTEGECAFTGGVFYNAQAVQFPSGYVGDYFFADFCGGWIRSYDVATDTPSNFATGIASPVDLKVDPAGNFYYLERDTGSVYPIQHPGTWRHVLRSCPDRCVICLPYGQQIRKSGMAAGAGEAGFDRRLHGLERRG